MEKVVKVLKELNEYVYCFIGIFMILAAVIVLVGKVFISEIEAKDIRYVFAIAIFGLVFITALMLSLSRNIKQWQHDLIQQ